LNLVTDKSELPTRIWGGHPDNRGGLSGVHGASEGN